MLNSIKSLSQGIKFKIRRDNKRFSDEYIINETCIFKCYNPPDFSIKDRFTVIDIGSHIGAFTVYAAKIAKRGIVYSYEPHPENFKLLKENIKINNLRNVRIFNLGALGRRKKVKLYQNEIGDSCHSIYNYNKSKTSVVINCISLKDIFDNNGIKFCDFLKMDCEGAEYDVIFNTPKKYFDKVSMMAMEYHDGIYAKRNIMDLKTFLRNMGFWVKVKPLKFDQGIIFAKKLVS